MDPRTLSLIMGAAGSGSAEKVYIEDVFSTWLYDGTTTTQTITNGIDLSGKGGMTWVKARTPAGYSNVIFDTARGYESYLTTNTTDASGTSSGVTANSDGFTLTGGLIWNAVSNIFTSWTFRKQAKFFDVVTYTGDGVAGRTVAHNLGSVPGCIIIKSTSLAGTEWAVYHRSLGAANYVMLHSTAASASTSLFNSTAPTSTVFSLGAGGDVNGNGNTYVAYLFAHDTSADGLIQCGSFTGGTGGVIDLGWEPQWLLLKNTSSVEDWQVFDNMRGIVPSTDFNLKPNTNGGESSGDTVDLTPTGFINRGYGNNTHTIAYIAIRRGPMKTPTDATKVFQPKVYTGSNVDNRLVTTDIVTDMVWVRQRNDSVLTGMVVGDRMRGQPYLLTGGTAAELSDSDSLDQQIVSAVEYGTAFSSMTGFWVGNDATSKLNANTTASNHVALAFRRAPGFFDIVAYTGTGANRTVSHNLGVVPELMVIKNRSDATGRSWAVYYGDNTDYLVLNTTAATVDDIAYWNDTSPTSSVFTVGTSNSTNESSDTFVAYLFASLTGVSKVGSYTGTGTTLAIDCGLTAGARFVLIKRTDSTGDWFVWDTARSIIAGNDPYLLLNSTAAEATNTDYIDPLNSGFQISSTAPAAINANGGTFIYLAIA